MKVHLKIRSPDVLLLTKINKILKKSDGRRKIHTEKL